jgi:hypothetical protein
MGVVHGEVARTTVDRDDDVTGAAPGSAAYLGRWEFLGSLSGMMATSSVSNPRIVPASRALNRRGPKSASGAPAEETTRLSDQTSEKKRYRKTR